MTLNTRVTAVLASICCCVLASLPPDVHGGRSVQNLKVDYRGGVDDPVTGLMVTYPLDGAIERPPVKLKTVIGIRPGGVKLFKQLYGEMSVCFDINNVTFGCSPLSEDSFDIQQWSLGTFTLQAYFSSVKSDREPIGKRYWLSTPTNFKVVDESDYTSQVQSFAREKQQKYREGGELSLVGWASLQQQQRHRELLTQLEADELGLVETAVENSQEKEKGDNEMVLLIGVKTEIATNFAHRQAIRETWASKNTLPRQAKVVFIGCRPFSSTNKTIDGEEEDTQHRQLRQAIELEKMVYGDLLTDELDCNDAYLDLANKVKEFLHFAATKYHHAQFVMIADDDLYARTDKLVEHFVHLGPQRRYYSGLVPSKQFDHKNRLTRTPDIRNALSKKIYPLSETPTVAMGAYFFLSMDCVEFVSKNRRRLRDLGGMDDITIPLWMILIQVHAQHISGLGYLRSEPCKDTFVALGDLPPLAIREVHSNNLEQRPLCHGFEGHMWHKSTSHSTSDYVSRALPSFSELLEFQFIVTNARNMGPIEVTTIISTKSLAGIKVSYFPSKETLALYSRRVCAESRLSFPSTTRGMSCAEVAVQLREKLQIFFKQTLASGAVESSRLALWEHNLFVKEQDTPPMIIACSKGVMPSSIIFESLFASMHLRRPIVVIDEIHLHRRFGGRPDVFVFSILDGDCEYFLKPACRHKIADYLRRYYNSVQAVANGGKKPCSVIMFSGEAWSVEGLDDRVLLISTVADEDHKRHAYLSMASASFAERIDHDPTALLVSQMEMERQSQPPVRKFCAYMYARCDRLEREIMFDMLNEMEPVDALGKCSGRAHIHKSRGQRPERYNDDAVERYKDYKFVIAFENSQAPGYVTEKLVNAFLAGSVPIYFGNSTTVSQLFNPKSFIDCGAFPSLQECARYVIQVHESPELYSAILREAPITNVEAFKEAFSWHPAVSSNFHAEEVMKYLEQ